MEHDKEGCLYCGYSHNIFSEKIRLIRDQIKDNPWLIDLDLSKEQLVALYDELGVLLKEDR